MKPGASVELSVVVPTHRPVDLEPTLRGLAAQSVHAIEVVVVENGTRDERVSRLCRAWHRHLDVRYHYDSRVGLNRARNTGVALSRARYIALLDDDCVPDRTWAEAVVARHRSQPPAGVIGGPVRLAFESPPPDWLVAEFRTCLAAQDRGAEALVLQAGDYLVGANLSFDRDVFLRAGGFPDHIGMTSREPPQLANDEIAFFDRLARRTGLPLAYCPGMSVTHGIGPHRATLTSMFQRRYGQGISDVRLLGWRHGGDPRPIAARYLQSVFPHRHHLEQLDARLGNMPPQTAFRYRSRHALCRFAYLAGFRTAMSREALAAGPWRRRATRVDASGRALERCTEGGGERFDSIGAAMAELLYRPVPGVQDARHLARADRRLRVLAALGALAAPALVRDRLAMLEEQRASIDWPAAPPRCVVNSGL